MSAEKPLWERMREAAEVLSEVASVYYESRAEKWCDVPFSSSTLHAIAKEWESVAVLKAEKEAKLAALKQEIGDALCDTGAPWTRIPDAVDRLLEKFDITPKGGAS